MEESLASTGKAPRLRHDPPEVPGFRLQTREAIPIGRLAVWAIVSSIPIGFLLAMAGFLIARLDEFVFTIGILQLLLIAFILLVAIPVLHEAVHGLVALAVGARPFFGVGRGYAYTSVREPLSPRQYALISVAPLIVLTLATYVVIYFFPEHLFYLLIFAIGNAVGAVGDLWILARIRGLPSDAIVYHLADGYAAFVPEK